MIWLQLLLSELGVKFQRIPILWFDNIGAQSLATNHVFHSKTKHIEIDVHFTRKNIANKVLEVHYVPTEEQLAGVLTKPFSIPRFQ